MALSKRLCDLRACSAGVVAVVTAMVLPLLLGFTSLGVEVGHWYLAQRVMQGAADAAAISAAADYICQYNGSCTSSGYQAVGVNYASLNGFTIPSSNVCLWTPNGNNCGSQQIPFTPTCPSSGYVCVAAEITQNTANWLTTKASFEPGSSGIHAIPTPTLMARAVVAIRITTTPGQAGNGCLLALETSGTGIQFNGGGSSGGFTGANCTLASNSTPTSLSGFNSNNASVSAYAAILEGSLSCPQNNCNFSHGVSHNLTPDPYTARSYGTAPSVPATQSAVTLSKSGTTVTVTLPQAAPYLFVGEQVIIKTTQVTVTSVISSAKFTYTASSIPTGTITFNPCVAFTPNASNAGGTDSQHMQCYTGGSTSGTTTFSRYSMFSTAITLGGTTIFNGTPTAPAVYAFVGGLTLGGNNTLGDGIYYVANGLTAVQGVVSCGVTANTATASNPTCPLNNNAYGGITFALTSGQFIASGGSVSLDWTALCTDSTGGQVGCDTHSNQILDAAGNSIDTSGIVLFSSRTGTGTGASLSGQDQFWLNGTLYFPNQIWSQSGRVNFNQTTCSAIIAQELDMSGNANMTNGCLTGVGGSPSVSSAGSPLLSQ